MESSQTTQTNMVMTWATQSKRRLRLSAGDAYEEIKGSR